MRSRCTRSLACVFACWMAARRCTAHRLGQSRSFFTVCTGSNEFPEPRGALGIVARRTRAIMQADGFGSPSPDDCNTAPDSPDPSHHDCLDDRGGMCLSFGGMEGTEPRAARLWRGQRN